MKLHTLGLLVSSVVFVALASGCDCNGAVVPGGACDGETPPASCGQACTDDTGCPTGFYCGADGCTADCAGTITPCPSGQTCTARGRCEPESAMDADVPRRDGTVEGVDANCASVDFSATGTIPSVILLIDRSRSMDMDFAGGNSRWEVLRRELLASDGLIATLESNVRFGIALYTAEGSGSCPDLITVPAVLDNYTAIDTEYRMHDVGLYTPTGDSITAVLSQLDTLAPERENTIIVLATDGEPNTCENRDTSPAAYAEGRVETLAAVDAAFAMDIRTYVISVGDDVGADHLQDVANAGLGNGPADPDAPYYVATDTAGLEAALGAIIGGVVSCELELSGSVNPDEACAGTVRLDGEVLPCDDPNGWRAIDSTHIELTGTACERLMGGAERVTATFPCDVVLI